MCSAVAKIKFIRKLETLLTIIYSIEGFREEFKLGKSHEAVKILSVNS